MDYLKLFNTHAEYEEAKSGLTLPNVSHCINEVEVHYNPFIETRLIVRYLTESANEEVMLYVYMEDDGEPQIDGSQYLDGAEIDGVDVPISDLQVAKGKYTFEESGEHIVKYTLKDPTNLGYATFGYCSNIVSVAIPFGVEDTNNATFAYCSSLSSVTIPNSVETIGTSVFVACENLTRVVIPNSVTSIGEQAFKDCSSLTSVNIPNSVTSIGVSAFENTGWFNNHSDGWLYLDGWLLNWKGDIQSIPSHLYIQNGTRGMGAWCLTELNFGVGFDNITAVTIPSSIQYINYEAFTENTVEITCLATTPPVVSEGTFYKLGSNGTLYAPQGSDYSEWGNYMDGWTIVYQ